MLFMEGPTLGQHTPGLALLSPYSTFLELPIGFLFLLSLLKLPVENTVVLCVSISFAQDKLNEDFTAFTAFHFREWLWD